MNNEDVEIKGPEKGFICHKFLGRTGASTHVKHDDTSLETYDNTSPLNNTQNISQTLTN